MDIPCVDSSYICWICWIHIIYDAIVPVLIEQAHDSRELQDRGGMHWHSVGEVHTLALHLRGSDIRPRITPALCSRHMIAWGARIRSAHGAPSRCKLWYAQHLGPGCILFTRPGALTACSVPAGQWLLVQLIQNLGYSASRLRLHRIHGLPERLINTAILYPPHPTPRFQIQFVSRLTILSKPFCSRLHWVQTDVGPFAVLQQETSNT